MQASDLDSTINRQSCEWLSEVALRLDVVIEVIDAHHVLVCPVGSTLEAAAIRRLLTSEEPSIRAALTEATRTKMPVPVGIEDMQAVCFGLAPGGMLLIARKVNGDESADECRHDLESIGLWLTGAIEASLRQPNAIGVEPYRIVSFRRILREATSRGSLRRVIGAFVEALSVWDDVRVGAYVAGASGGFLQYVSTISSLPSSSPDQLEETALPRRGRLRRLSRAESDRIGLSDSGDTVILRIAIGTETEWLLAFSGMIDDRVEARLRVYSDILRESLNDVLTTINSRLIAEVGRRQLSSSEALETATQTALGQLTAAVAGRQGALAVTTAGRQVLAVGQKELLATPDQSRLNRLIVRLSDTGGVMTVVVERDQGSFTAFEREIVQAGMAAMHPWVQSALRRTNEAERRHGFQPIDTMFDQLATEAVAGGQHVSVIVLSVSSDAAGQRHLSAWVGKIRGQLRGCDRAGILSEREIAVLLCGASADQAAIVSSRLKRIFEVDDVPQDFRYPTFGMTTRIPDSPFEGSLVGAARASAAAAPR
jgi:hypothetical protein